MQKTKLYPSDYFAEYSLKFPEGMFKVWDLSFRMCDVTVDSKEEYIELLACKDNLKPCVVVFWDKTLPIKVSKGIFVTEIIGCPKDYPTELFVTLKAKELL